MKLLAAIAQRRSAIVVAASALLLDQVSKDVAANLLSGETPVPVGPLAMTLAKNPGAALGAFGSLPEVLRIPLVIGMSVGVLLVLLPLIAIRVEPGPWRQAGIALVLGGTLGNLIDRVLHGYVVDFITVNPAVFERFPVFNLADVAVILGAVLLLLFLQRSRVGKTVTLFHVPT